MIHIKYLDLDQGNTQLRDLCVLENMPDLVALDVRGSLVESLNGILSLDRITTLNLSGLSLTSLEWLPSFPRLQSLEIARNRLLDLSGLGMAPGLRKAIAAGAVARISGLAAAALDIFLNKAALLHVLASRFPQLFG